jgi:glucose dehydrogenase
MAETHIYAYRDWQSTGVRLLAGDEVTIRAEGRWLYTPDEYHGPEGHPRFPAPAFYPVSGTAGGVLIGRIGPSGVPFVVGRRTRTYAADSGMLYLRINDDRLTDNDGHITAEITVIPYEVE